MKKSFLFLSFVCFCISLSATDQWPDILIYKNQRLFAKDWKPEILFDYLPSEVGNSIRGKEEGYTTGCYRGYVATWILENDSIFLTNIETFRGKKISLEEYFPGEVSEKGVFAHWFNSIIWAGTEDILNWRDTEKYKASFRVIAQFKNGVLQRDYWRTLLK